MWLNEHGLFLFINKTRGFKHGYIKSNRKNQGDLLGSKITDSRKALFMEITLGETSDRDLLLIEENRLHCEDESNFDSNLEPNYYRVGLPIVIQSS